MTSSRVLAALGLALLAAAPAAAQGAAPYAGQQARAIKSLSDAEVADLLAGRGMGLAKAAELNSFPGPLHALELAERLALDGAQRAAIESQFARMSAAAKALGARVVDAERTLDAAFAAGAIDADALARKTANIAALQGELRAVHLRAHLETRATLRPDQVALYNEARGYGAAAGAPAHTPSGPRGHGGHGRH